MNVLPNDRHLTYQLQYRKCGKLGCHPCGKRGHGPYWIAYWKEGGRVRSKHIPHTDEDCFPRHAIGLLSARSTLTTFPLSQQTLLLELTAWASKLPQTSLHTIFLSPHNLVIIPLLEETTKTLLFLHFNYSASVRCVPAAFQTRAPQSLKTLETRYSSIRTSPPRLFEDVDQTLLDQFAATYQEAALTRSDAKSGLTSRKT